MRGSIRGSTDIIKDQGRRAAGPPMGAVVKRLGGRASGRAINALVVGSISKILGEPTGES